LRDLQLSRFCSALGVNQGEHYAAVQHETALHFDPLQARGRPLFAASHQRVQAVRNRALDCSVVVAACRFPSAVSGTKDRPIFRDPVQRKFSCVV
jgi:hypothetical protein